MAQLDTIRALLSYSDWANRRILEAAAELSDDRLDAPMQAGPGDGQLRRVLLHTFNGESVWLQRCRGRTETKWPSEAEKVSVRALLERFEACWKERDAFLATVTDADLAREMPYRDSRGSLFRATLGEMLLQTIVHSTHHRAQAANILRRLGLPAPELDYMYHTRRPA